MKIPDKIKIKGHEINIIKKEQVTLEGKEVLGFANIDQNIIEIQSKNIPESLQAMTLLHEILHFNAHYEGISLSEKLVESISSGLFAVIRDNKLRF